MYFVFVLRKIGPRTLSPPTGPTPCQRSFNTLIGVSPATSGPEQVPLQAGLTSITFAYKVLQSVSEQVVFCDRKASSDD